MRLSVEKVVIAVLILVISLTMLFGIHLSNIAFHEGWNAGRDWKETQINDVLKCYKNIDCLFDEDNIDMECVEEFAEAYKEIPTFRDWRYTVQS